MPRKPIDYSKVVIYKIVCNDLNVTNCYVGHTTDFKSRKNCHKSDCNNEKKQHYNLKIYKSIRDNGGWENWSMIEVEKYPCNDANEARKKEREWFEKLKANLNCDVPGRTQKEYCKDNRDKINEKQSEYNKDNRDKINKRQSEYNEKNRDKINARRRERYRLKKEMLV